jgi:ABC-type Zn2+ transport system substrate-binding protein/surface adhesin
MHHPPATPSGARRTIAFLVTVVLLAGVVTILAILRGRTDVPRGGTVVTLLPYRALAGELTRDTGIPVHLLIPPGASPHTHALRPSEVARIAASRLVLADGIHDASILTVAQGHGEDGPRVVPLATDPAVQAALPAGFQGDTPCDDPNHDHDGEHHHGHGPAAHVWLDPVATRQIVARMAAALADAYPEHAGQLSRNARSLDQQLAALHAELEARAATIRGRPFLVLHSAFAVLAARYELDLVSSIQDQDGRAPTPTRLAKLHRYRDERGLVAIFTEPQLDATAAQALAQELDLPLFELDPLGSSESTTYGDLLRNAMDTLTTALGAGR